MNDRMQANDRMPAPVTFDVLGKRNQPCYVPHQRAAPGDQQSAAREGTAREGVSFDRLAALYERTAPRFGRVHALRLWHGEARLTVEASADDAILPGVASYEFCIRTLVHAGRLAASTISPRYYVTVGDFTAHQVQPPGLEAVTAHALVTRAEGRVTTVHVVLVDAGERLLAHGSGTLRRSSLLLDDSPADSLARSSSPNALEAHVGGHA